MRLQELTLTAAFIRYYEEVCRGNNYGERGKRYHMKVLLEAIGPTVLLSQLDDLRINAAVQWLKTRKPAKKGRPLTLSPVTINRYLMTLNSVCQRARKLWGVAAGDWKWSEHEQDEPEGREVFLDRGQVQALVEQCCGHLRPMLLLDFMTGLRLGNVLGLQWESISFDMARAVLIQKGKRRLSVSLPAPALDLLASIEPDPAQRKGPVFRIGNPNTPCGCAYCSNPRHADQPIKSVKTAFAKARRAAGLDDLPSGRFRFHDVRHTFASFVLAKGGDLKIVQEALGHRRITTTARYAHLIPGRKEAVIGAVADYLAAPKREAEQTVIIADPEQKAG
jgi:integrase